MKPIRIFICLAFGFCLSSCVEDETTVHLKKDGSGAIVKETVMGEQMLAMLGGFNLNVGEENVEVDPMEGFYDEEKFKEEALKFGEGVTYVGFEKVERKGGKGVRVRYEFKDINTVKLAMSDGTSAMGADMAGEEEEAQEPITFAYAEGVLTIKFPGLKADENEEEGEDNGMEDLSNPMVQGMLKDMRIAMRLVIESGIEKTSAKYVDGDTITLMDVRFGELFANPDGVKALGAMDSKGSADREEIAELVNRVDGIDMEMQETVTVELK